MAAGRSQRGSFRSVLPSIEETVEDSDDEEERQDLALTNHPCSISVVSVTSEVLLNSPNPASGDKENLDQNSALADIASPYT